MLRGPKFQELKSQGQFLKKIKRRVYIPFSKVYIPPTKVEVKFSQRDETGFLRKRTIIHEIPRKHVAVCASTYPCKQIGPLIFFDDKDTEYLEEKTTLLSQKDVDKTVLFRPDINESYLSKKISALTNDIFKQELESFEKKNKASDTDFGDLTMNLKDDLIFLPFYEVTNFMGKVSYVNAFQHSPSKNTKLFDHSPVKISEEIKVDRQKFAFGMTSSMIVLAYISSTEVFVYFILPTMLLYSVPLFFNIALFSSHGKYETDDYLTENQEIIDNNSIQSSEMIDLIDEFNSKGVFKFNQFSGANVPTLCELFELTIPFTQDELKVAYLRLLKKHHPDNPDNKDKDSSNHFTQLIIDSYKLLQAYCNYQ